MTHQDLVTIICSVISTGIGFVVGVWSGRRDKSPENADRP